MKIRILFLESADPIPPDFRFPIFCTATSLVQFTSDLEDARGPLVLGLQDTRRFF